MLRLFGSVLIAAAVTIALPWPGQAGGDEPANTETPPVDRFELKHGDRVVFLGNAFFEREGRDGYIETMLTTRYPGRRITFRNLGWSGDTVWGETRGSFEPEKGYQNLIDLIAELKPTVIFLAYGNEEAFAGEKGLKPFVKQYNKLLDDLERFTKRIVIIAPLAQELVPIPKIAAAHNRRIDEYRRRIQVIADQRRYLCIDLAPGPLSTLVDTDASLLSVDGQQLRPLGYWFLARDIRYLVSPDPPIGIMIMHGQDLELFLDPDTDTDEGNVAVDSTEYSVTDDKISFGVRFAYVPECINPGTNEPSLRKLFIRIVEHGSYSLRIDGTPTITFSAKEWRTARIPVTEVQQTERLRQAIIAKNQLFFDRWRPQDTRCLFGFRKREQGQNAKEMAQFDPQIAAKEEEILKLAQPVPHKYELIRIKELGKGDNKRNDETASAKKGAK
jgi:hypothetical protein